MPCYQQGFLLGLFSMQSTTHRFALLCLLEIGAEEAFFLCILGPCPCLLVWELQRAYWTFNIYVTTWIHSWWNTVCTELRTGGEGLKTWLGDAHRNYFYINHRGKNAYSEKKKKDEGTHEHVILVWYLSCRTSSVSGQLGVKHTDQDFPESILTESVLPH